MMAINLSRIESTMEIPNVQSYFALKVWILEREQKKFIIFERLKKKEKNY